MHRGSAVRIILIPHLQNYFSQRCDFFAGSGVFLVKSEGGRGLRREDHYEPGIQTVIMNYYDMVFKLAYARTKNRYDAEDVAQDVFLRYVRKRPYFENKDHEKAWFLRVTINCSNSFFTLRSKVQNIPLLDQDGFVSSEEENALKEVLDQLPKKYRTVLHLHYYEDLKITDIAQLLGMKESAVKMQLARAKKLLKLELEKENGYV